MATEPQSTDEAIRYGVDSDALAAFVDYAEANPEEVQFELSARGYWEGRAFHTLSKIGPYSLGGQAIERERHETTRSRSGRTRRSRTHSGSSILTTARR